MVYITTMQSPVYRQMTLEEFLFPKSHDAFREFNPVVSRNETNTRTICVERVSPQVLGSVDVQALILSLSQFNAFAGAAIRGDIHTYYKTFYMLKRSKTMGTFFKGVFDSQKRFVKCDSKQVCSGLAQILAPLIAQHPTTEHAELFGNTKTAVLQFLNQNGFDENLLDFDQLFSSVYRKIDAPNEALQGVLQNLKTMFEDRFHVLYHTAAFAYVKGRCTVDAAKRHQKNESRWYAKLDLSNFFGSTTPEFVMAQLSQVFPFSEVVRVPEGREALERAIGYAFLDGGLPQGTKLSPLLTNIMMIPVDHELSKQLRGDKQGDFVYTRYADDFTVSSKYNFDVHHVEEIVRGVLTKFNAPFRLNESKTTYGSSKGTSKNFVLGVVINHDNEVTVGYKAIHKMCAKLTAFVLDYKNGVRWSHEDLMQLSGLLSYYNMVNNQKLQNAIRKIDSKYHANTRYLLKQALKAS